MKVFISQPMAGKTADEIKLEKDGIIDEIKSLYPDAGIIDSFVTEQPPEDCTNVDLWYLGQSLTFLAKSDVAYFAEGWRKNRGCKIEYDAAVAYGIPIVRKAG